MGILSSFCGLLQNRKYHLFTPNHIIKNPFIIPENLWGSTFHLIFASHLFSPFPFTFIHSLFHVLPRFCIIVPLENLNVIRCFANIQSSTETYNNRANEKVWEKKQTPEPSRHSLSSLCPVTHATGPCLYRMFHLYSDSC